MGLLQEMNEESGYLKATFQGPQGAGKTRTAVELACQTWKVFGSKKPVAFYDTETGSTYVKDIIQQRTGRKGLVVKSRAFKDLIAVTNECVSGAADVLVVDSITHVWRELNAAYMKKMNDERQRKGWSVKNRMDIQDIMQVKDIWYMWPDLFLTSPLHIIVCGREGNEWGHEENEETGKREMVQVGKKMKVEAEFGYEASLMVAMSLRQDAARRIKKRSGVEEKPRELINVATIIKDRFDEMNGQTFDFPTGETFMPFLKRLRPGAHTTVNTEVTSDASLPQLTEDGNVKEKRERVITCEEIQGEMVRAYPSQSAEHKQAKADMLDRVFHTRSWTRVESLPLHALKDGLAAIRKELGTEKEIKTEEPSLAAAAEGVF